MRRNKPEGCGRTKLFLLTAAADSATLKVMIEFREETSIVEGPAVPLCQCWMVSVKSKSVRSTKMEHVK